MALERQSAKTPKRQGAKAPERQSAIRLNTICQSANLGQSANLRQSAKAPICAKAPKRQLASKRQSAKRGLGVTHSLISGFVDKYPEAKADATGPF